MTMTPNLQITLLEAAQAQKHVTVNEALSRLDALTHLAVVSRQAGIPPEDLTDGECWLLPEAPTGPWQGQGGKLAIYLNGGWRYVNPVPGMRLWIADEGHFVLYDGAAWAALTENLTEFGVNTTPDETNRLAVKSDAVLLSHDDTTPGSGDMRLSLNKASSSHTSSLLFQSNWSARAEFGLAGEDHFSLKTSADGAAFRTVMQANSATGIVDFPQGVTSQGVAVSQIAEAFTEHLKNQLYAEDNNLGRTTSVALAADAPSGTTNNMVIASAADNNPLYVNGEYLTSLSSGQVYPVAYPQGTVFASDFGHFGVTRFKGGPAPMGSSAFAARRFLFYAFRYAVQQPSVYVSTASLPASVVLKKGDGTVVSGPHDLTAYDNIVLTTQDNGEYRLEASQPVMLFTCGINSSGAAVDNRLVPPPSTRLIGHSYNAYICSGHQNTQVKYFLNDGQTGTFLVSPGAPVSLRAVLSQSYRGYAPQGFVLLKAGSPVSAFSSADGTGGEATPFFSENHLSQFFPLPLIDGTDTNPAASGIAIASPYTGNARVFDSSGALLNTYPLTRNLPVATADIQSYPAATRFFEGFTIPGGWIETDVPAFCVLNSKGDPNIFTNGDETALVGITPDELRIEMRKGADGLLYRREISAGGAASWILS